MSYLKFGRLYAPEKSALTHPFKLKELARYGVNEMTGGATSGSGKRIVGRGSGITGEASGEWKLAVKGVLLQIN